MIDEFGDCAGMPDTYRGWKINPFPWDYWTSYSPDYFEWRDDKNGWVHNGNILQAATREELIAAIDAWILENGQ